MNADQNGEPLLWEEEKTLTMRLLNLMQGFFRRARGMPHVATTATNLNEYLLPQAEAGMPHSASIQSIAQSVHRAEVSLKNVVKEGASFVWQRVLVPPVLACLLGLACSSWPVSYWLLCGGDYPNRLPGGECPTASAPLGWITSGVMHVGRAAGPIGLFLIGNALSKGPSWAALPLGTNVAIALAKMVVMPLSALCVVALWDWLIPLPEPFSHYCYLTAITLAATPTANNVIVMSELAGSNREAMGTCIFVQYLCSPVLLGSMLTLAMIASRVL